MSQVEEGQQLKSKRKQLQQANHDAIGSQRKPNQSSVQHNQQPFRLWRKSMKEMKQEADRWPAGLKQLLFRPLGGFASANGTPQCRARAEGLRQVLLSIDTGRLRCRDNQRKRQAYTTTIVAGLLSSFTIFLVAYGQPARGLQLQEERQSAIIGQHHNNVIPFATSTTTTTATARLGAQPKFQQSQQQQTAHLEPLPFKYHLNHLNPPSLVPINTEQHLGQQASSASSAGRPHDLRLQQQPAQWRRWAQEQASGLVQLQLPLKLHLKLKPLPLPMPPPPPPPVALAAPESRRSSNEKRRRSLLEQPAKSSSAPTTTQSPVETKQTKEQEERERKNLMALTWREAKRVLLLSSMMSSPAMSQVERRSAKLDLNDNSVYKSTMTSEIEQPASGNLLTQPVEDSSTLAAESRQFSTASDQPTAIPAVEVRRQRHSSQQQLQGQLKRLEPDADAARGALANESRFQALAAAMLPLFWPSFQATSPITRLQALSLTGSGEAKPLKFKQIARQQPSVAASSPSPSFATDPTTERSTTMRPAPEITTTTTKTIHPPTQTTTTSQPAKLKSRSVDRQQPAAMLQERTTRKRRRKPTYLAGSVSVGYPDSTRMASKYPMPRLKFGQSSTPLPQLTTPNPQGGAEVTKRVPSQSLGVPKSLSKIIEQQLLMNATSLLQQHKQRNVGQLFAHLAPSTSVTKLVRLRNDTELMQVVRTSSTPMQLNRLNVSSTSKPQQMTSTLPPVLAATTLRPPSTMPPTTTTTTTTTAQPTTTTTTTTEPPSATTSRHKDSTTKQSVTTWSEPESHEEEPEEKTAKIERPSVIPKSGGGGKKYGSRAKLRASQPGTRSNNIKLFHFKRKPDFNKLPFYKKPLNYTELGWTPEQIQEHLESIGFMTDSGRNAVKAPRTVDHDGVGQPLKRKRRGKSQFERLMAELHGPPSTTEPPLITTVLADSEGEPNEDVGGATTEGEVRVPLLLSKKTTKEPLVMKPMFFVMNQKRRPVSNQTESTPTQRPINLDSDGETPIQRASNKSKAIIRMRRKHHGEQPTNLLSASELQTPWRPSKPTLVQQHQLMLVPSGLLTPSGSHLMPLYTSALERPAARQGGQPVVALAGDQQKAKLVGQLFANWRPSSWREPKPSGGLAPSGEESFLQAPSAPGERIVLVASSSPVASQMKTTSQVDQPQQQPRPQQFTGEQAATEQLRVPKLLSKPMRPAKYSLNGYIPKPSLGQQQQQQQTTSPLQTSPMISISNPAASQKQAKKQRPLTTAPSALQTAAGQQGKDLDSSTSNEIFSRRRGLQQQQQQTRLQLQPVENGRRNGLQATNSTPKSEQQSMSLARRQLEEKKRKYILQQQLALKSTTLSVQKANQIKAKLGLVVSNNTGHVRLGTNSDSAQQASTNSVLTLDPPADGEMPAATGQVGGLIGAPLNSIPKTDFECTDKRGKFVAGLFADHKTGCQVWHLCSNNRKYSFLCPSGTIFNAKLRICDWRYNVKCESSAPF